MPATLKLVAAAPRPKRLPTPKQAEVTANLSLIARTWRTLSDPQRMGWNALGQVWSPVPGKSAARGFLVFQSLNGVRLNSQQGDILPDAPAQPDFIAKLPAFTVNALRDNASPALALSADTSPDIPRFQLQINTSAFHFPVLVLATRPLSAGVTAPDPKQFRQIATLPSLTAPLTDITDAYLSQFQAPALGMKIALQLVPITPNGFKGSPFTQIVSVAAAKHPLPASPLSRGSSQSSSALTPVPFPVLPAPVALPLTPLPLTALADPEGKGKGQGDGVSQPPGNKTPTPAVTQIQPLELDTEGKPTMFRTAKTTLALAATLAATLPMTAFADPHHDHGNRGNSGYTNSQDNDQYNQDNNNGYNSNNPYYNNQYNQGNNNRRDRDNNDSQNNNSDYNNRRDTHRDNNNRYNNNSYGNYRTQSPQANRQQNKNTWRNLGTAGAGVALFGLLNHNSAATLLGAAGAAYSANRYEQDRHSQSQQQNGDGYNRRNY